MSAPHMAPAACFVCGGDEHPPTDLHTYWPNAEAEAWFNAQPDGAVPSMTAVETLDPREAVTW